MTHPLEAIFGWIKHFIKFVSNTIGLLVKGMLRAGALPAGSARNSPSGKGKFPLQTYNVGAPFERIQVDILGPLPVTSSGNKYLLVVVDCFTKWPEAVPLKNKRADTVARFLVEQVLSCHGMSLELHIDQGRNFKPRLFYQLASLLGIKKTCTTPLHPQWDGQVERQHRTILDYLAKFISKNQTD